jgi:hypothetical protein
MKLDLLTNATVVDDAIMFVSEKSKDKEKEQVKSSSSFPSDSSNEDNNKKNLRSLIIMMMKTQIKQGKKNRKRKLEK